MEWRSAAPFAESHLRCFPLLRSWFLLMIWRSAHRWPQTDLCASTHPSSSSMAELFHQNSKSPCPTFSCWKNMGQELMYSPAVPPKLIYVVYPLFWHTIICPSLITDEVPVSVYSLFTGFKLPSQVHSLSSRLPYFHPPTALWWLSVSYFSCSLVCLLSQFNWMKLF